jgi:23S rRNA (pseudouridine1915-N3)-methyltransferase
VASVGRDRSGLFDPAVKEYANRLSHYTRFELIELPHAKGRLRSTDAKLREAAILLEQLARNDRLVALDARGTQMSSLELSRYLQRAQNDARDLLFVIGGDEGLAEGVLNASHLTLSLSTLTLPHRLARLVLVEQLYRAFTILRGEPYAK